MLYTALFYVNYNSTQYTLVEQHYLLALFIQIVIQCNILNFEQYYLLVLFYVTVIQYNMLWIKHQTVSIQ